MSRSSGIRCAMCSQLHPFAANASLHPGASSDHRMCRPPS